MRNPLIILTIAMLAACSGVTPQPADPATTQRIVSACLASGLFKTGIGFGLSFAGPPGEVANQVIGAGVDKVCADPERFSSDISTVEWVVKNLAASAKSRL